MKPNLFFKILIFTYLLYYICCYKGFTIDSEGKNVITTKIITDFFSFNYIKYLLTTINKRLAAVMTASPFYY